MRILFFVLLFSASCLASTKEVSGILRFLDGKWVLLDQKDQHGSLNVINVCTNEWDATVNFNFKAKKVYSFIVSTDDAYSMYGYQAGASVGLDSAIIRFGRLGVPQRSTQMKLDGSAIFFHGLFED